MDSKEPCTPSNCLRIVIFHILYEQSWHTLTTDNEVWGWMIPVKGINCIVIAAQPVNAETEFIIIHVVHYQIACRLSYYISYMHGNGISGILIPTFGYISYHSWQFLALTVPIPTKNILKIVLYSIKLIADCHISHSICTELAYMDY
jgi:hypothetical protein